MVWYQVARARVPQGVEDGCTAKSAPLTLVYLGYVFQKELSESPAIVAYRR